MKHKCASCQKTHRKGYRIVLCAVCRKSACVNCLALTREMYYVCAGGACHMEIKRFKGPLREVCFNASYNH